MAENITIGGIGGHNWYGGARGSGSGMGGAIFNYQGQVDVVDTLIEGNSALIGR